VTRFGELIRKLWNNRNFKGQVGFGWRGREGWQHRNVGAMTRKPSFARGSPGTALLLPQFIGPSSQPVQIKAQEKGWQEGENLGIVQKLCQHELQRKGVFWGRGAWLVGGEKQGVADCRKELQRAACTLPSTHSVPHPSPPLPLPRCAVSCRVQVSPHEFMQAVMSVSQRRFTIEQQSDPVEFWSWLLNTLHLALTGNEGGVGRGGARRGRAGGRRSGKVGCSTHCTAHLQVMVKVGGARGGGGGSVGGWVSGGEGRGAGRGSGCGRGEAGARTRRREGDEEGERGEGGCLSVRREGERGDEGGGSRSKTGEREGRGRGGRRGVMHCTVHSQVMVLVWQGGSCFSTVQYSSWLRRHPTACHEGASGSWAPCLLCVPQSFRRGGGVGVVSGGGWSVVLGVPLWTLGPVGSVDVGRAPLGFWGGGCQVQQRA